MSYAETESLYRIGAKWGGDPATWTLHQWVRMPNGLRWATWIDHDRPLSSDRSDSNTSIQNIDRIFMKQLRIKTNGNGGYPAEEMSSKPRFDPNAIDWEAVEAELAQEQKSNAKPGFDANKDYGVRYSRHTGKYWIFSSGLWIEVGPNEVRRHLQIEEGCSACPLVKGLPSDVDEAMHAAIKHYAADKIGSYAGYLHQGITKLPNGDTLLVPTARKLLRAVQGDSEFVWGFLSELLPHPLQADALRSWSKVAVRSLYLGEPGKWTPKQVLALLGLSGIGKTSLQESIITPLLGYRQENCAPYLTGQSTFNRGARVRRTLVHFGRRLDTANRETDVSVPLQGRCR